jgi:uncharacterized protein (DUF2336 family)
MSFLTWTDVKRLLAEPSAAVRAELAEKLGSEIASEALTETELGIAAEITRILASDIEAEVRANLANSLRCSNRLPHDVALRLASDIDKVALPVLAESQVLTPADLIALVRNRSPVKQQAIAGRNGLPEEVSDVLIDEGHAAAVVALMRNRSAGISEQGFGRALDRFPNDAGIKEGMTLRETLPIRVAERLVAVVSDRLRNYLVMHHELSAQTAADLVLRSRDLTTIKLAYSHAEEELENLAREMQRHGRLTPVLVLRSICVGDMAFFEAAMAAMAKVPVANARTLIDDAGPYGLVALFDKTGMEQRLFAAFRVAVDVARGVPFDGDLNDLEGYRRQVLTRVLAQFEQFDEDDLAYFRKQLEGLLRLDGQPTPRSRLSA